MIEGYIGRPGSGKSYRLTERVLREANRGRECYVNWGLKHPNVYMFGPEDLLQLPPGLIAIDEAHLWFSARQSLQLPPSWLAGLSQTRKKQWDLLWAAQHENRVDRVLRDVSNWMYLCTAWLAWDGHPVLFKAVSYEPETFRRSGKEMGASWKWFSRKVVNAYDTYETLQVAAHTARKNDMYAKPAPKEKPTAVRVL